VYITYTLLLALGMACALPYYWWRGRSDGRYLRTFRERMGRLPPGLSASGPSIWIHAVSVGEVIAAGTLIAPLRRRFPAHALFLSTTTLTGHTVAHERLSGLDGLFFAPFDFPGPVRSTLRAIRPALFVLIDTELWPNMLWQTHRSGAKIALVNGRISERSFPRYKRLRPWLTRVLENVDVFLMQAEIYAERLVAVGAVSERVRVTGSLKFDAAREESPSAELRARLGTPSADSPLWVAGSTVPDEESAVLEAFGRVRREHPRTRLLLAPRHPERADQVSALIQAAGFHCVRRSQLQPGEWSSPETVLLLDTLGELAQTYSLASVVFVGGSLVPKGGHNILEAAAAARPIIVGPHMHNFQQIAEVFRAEGAMLEVSTGAALGEAVSNLLGDPVRCAALGQQGRAIIERHRGVVARTVDSLADLLREH
jgi:3-deoxy-D-manno-octulosonic-acid transferase